MSENEASFGKMGKSYQEKVVASIITDTQFAEQMADVLHPKYFELKYLEVITDKFFEHKKRYKTYPSLDLIDIMITKEDGADPLICEQVKAFINNVTENPLNGDRGFIQESALDFCRKQTLKEAMILTIDKIEESKFDDIQSIIKEALAKGASYDLGQDYMDSLKSRATKGARLPMSTGWPIIDRELNGGWERKILVTFIAPTGAGKSMFLVNCGASAVANGLNVIYITCEMADYKIGLRFDSYFSGIEINNVQSKQDEVEAALTAKVKGKLFIKEFPTKSASVQTIRSYLQRLNATKEFHPDILIVDYADLLRASHRFGEKRHELEGVYEELRCLAQELNCVVITADQTNRSGLNDDIVTLSSIAESYAKATVCDVIMTVSRKTDDRQTNSGRLYIAKSRLGQDGKVFPFLMNTATVKATVLEQGVDPVELFLDNKRNLQEKMSNRFDKLMPLKNSSGS